MKTVIPAVEHGIVSRLQNSLFRYQGWPTVTRDEKGVLYAASSSFRVAHICPFGKTAMYISKNEGKTWTPPIVVNDTYMDDRDAGILAMGDGKLLISWFTHSAESYAVDYYEDILWRPEPAAKDATVGVIAGYAHLPEEMKQGGSYVRISEDGGVTWSEPIRLPVTAPHGPTKCRDGSLIYLGTEHYIDGKNNYLGPWQVMLYRSVDSGYTWNYQSTVTPPSWLKEGESLQEPHILELPDGRLLGAFRIDGRKPFGIATAFSDDGGLTWSDVKDLGVSGSPPHLMLHSSGALICSYGRREHPRSIRAMVSYDLGESWDTEYLLDDRSAAFGADLGYASSVELSDGSIFTVYYQKFPGDDVPSILSAKWRLFAEKCE